MAKNMTRKGLALGAGAALIATSLVSTPAYAVSEVVTGLGVGTSYNTLAGTGYALNLETNVAAGAWTAAKLKYRVQNADGRLVRPQVSNGTTAVTPDDDNTKMGTYLYGSTTVAVEASDYISSLDFVVAPKDDSANYKGVTSAVNNLTLNTSYVTANSAVTITAWIDENGNNTIDATEYSAPSKVVSFYIPSAVTATTTLTAPVVGDATLVATTTTSPALNGGQLPANAIQVAFTAQGNSNAVLAQSTTADGSTMGTNTWGELTQSWTSTAHLAYSITGDQWNGTDSAVTDVNLDGFTYGNGNTATAAVFTKSSHGFTVAAHATHYVIFGAKDDDVVANSAKYDKLLAKAGLTVATNTISYTTAGLTAEAADDEEFDSGSLRALVAGTTATAVAGTHSATAYIGTTKIGVTSASNPVAATGTQGTLTVVSNANVGPKSDNTGQAVGVVPVRTGTTSVDFTYTAVDTNGVALTAGRPVVVSLETLQNASDASSTTKIGTFKIDGFAVTTRTLLTDATGSVSFTLTEDDGDKLAQVQVRAVSEGVTGTAGEIDLNWIDAAYTLYDLNVQNGHLGQRTVETAGSYTFDLALLDQWMVGADSTKYRLLTATTNRMVSSTYQTLDADGTKSYTVTDGAIGATMNITLDVSVEVLSAAGTWGSYASGGSDWDGTSADNSSDELAVVNVIADQNDTIVLDAAAGSTYDYKAAQAEAADFDDTIAAKATVAQDRRSDQTARAAYANAVTVHGGVQNSLTGLARAGALVTASGPSDILFSVGAVDAFGSLTTVADNNGFFTFELFSNKVQLNTVITFTTTDGASKTQKVTFVTAGVDSGTTVSFAGTPTKAAAGSTFQVVATLTDAFGNTVESSAADVDVTYTGPGIVFATLPNKTDVNGQVKFAVLLGSNDSSGTATVTVGYDINNDGDYIDLNESLNTYVITIGTGVASATKVNAGSFKGYVALYAKGYKGQRMSAKVGKDWVVVASLASDFERVVRYTGAGYDIVTTIYIDGVSVQSFNVTTK